MTRPVSDKPKKSKSPRNPDKVKVGSADVALTAMQTMFVAEYLVDLNARQAAIRAGYSEKTASEMGYENLTKPQIQAAIAQAREKQQERTGITADRVLKEAARIAFFDPRKLFDDSGRPIHISALDDETAAAIAGLDVCSIGNADMAPGEVVKYKISDKNSALEKLFKHFGMYEKDNKQRTDPLSMLLEAITKGANSGFKPVQSDPEHDE